MPPMPKNAAEKSPLYKQVEQYLTQQIYSGRWPGDAALPNEWGLAAEIGVSQGTVRKALSRLTAQGLLCRQQGVGTFVSGTHPEWGLFPLCDGHDARRTVWPKQEILHIAATHAPPAVRDNLNLEAGERVWHVQTLWRKSHQPVAFDEAWLPMPPLPDLNRLQRDQRAGIYGLLAAAYRIVLLPAPMTLHSAVPDGEAAARLKAAPYTAAVRCERISRTETRPMEWRRRLMVLEHIGLVLPAAI